MRRHAALLELSRQHHAALVLAHRIAVADEDAAFALMRSVPAIFRLELEPHFRAEETRLLPLLEGAGEDALALRTVEEHRLLRVLAARLAAGDGAELKAFGSSLEAHVRFEEREMFPVVQLLLRRSDEEDSGPLDEQSDSGRVP